MEFSNFTPFPANAWENVNSRRKWHATCLVRVKFKLLPASSHSSTPADESQRWLLQLDKDQGDLFAEDQFFGEPETSSVRFESDYVSYKPHTDIIVNATSYAPDQRPQSGWPCGVKVTTAGGDLVARQLLSITPPTADYIAVPVRYEYAKGGVVNIQNQGQEDQQYHLDMYNPVGAGPYPHAHQAHKQSVLINADNNHSSDANIPPGLGFIHRSWKNRLDYAGTYNQEWLEKQHPYPPHDFDHQHHQGAHPSLIVKNYLKAGAMVQLLNLHRDAPQMYFTLPKYRFLSRVFTNTQKQYQVMNLDTLIINLNSDKPDEDYALASWRSYTPLMETALKAEAMLLSNTTATDRGRSQPKEHV
ncbi:MAG: DUF2169 domain-containing protein [Pseudomonadota bacterium]